MPTSSACSTRAAARKTPPFVRIGLASHNLFDLAYALLLRAREDVEDRVEFEMLEGMANHQARVVNDAAGGLLLYAPVVNRDDFHSAIAYLVRRLDENTAEENFLRDLFGMEPGDAAWDFAKSRFLRACARKDSVMAGPRRTQNRATEHPDCRCPPDRPSTTRPDTDWALPQNVAWIRAKVAAMRAAPPVRCPCASAAARKPGKRNHRPRSVAPGRGGLPLRPGRRAQVERALQTAVNARAGWQALGFAGRAALLRQAAAEIANSRGDIIATMVLDGGKAGGRRRRRSFRSHRLRQLLCGQFADPASSTARLSAPSAPSWSRRHGISPLPSPAAACSPR
jgi:RHH-type transcriptional regulator, proline utilization regulon repressor / proline dehydrogenase / delta 1-pyrroline-5-carboxylate dehydrogenase